LESVTIERGKQKYIFYQDRLEIEFRGKIRSVIRYDELEEITYNPKTEREDFLTVLSRMFVKKGCSFGRDAFVLFPRDRTAAKKAAPYGFVLITMSKDEFRMVQSVIPMHIRMADEPVPDALCGTERKKGLTPRQKAATLIALSVILTIACAGTVLYSYFMP